MSRPIDADELKEQLAIWEDYDELFVGGIRKHIDDAPTIEPRKGKWHYTDAYPHWMCCDQCFKKFLPNKEWVELYNIPTNYCPNCGADMRNKI